MGALIDNNDNQNEVVVDGRNGSVEISLQTYQDIYNQITGKSEETTKISKKSIHVNFDDIKQLDSKINQILEQYRVVSSNSTFTIFFDKNQKETYSSLERFSSFNSSVNACTESVVVKYNFAIVLPQTNRPQNYTIAIRLISRVTAKRKMLEDFPVGVNRSFLMMISSKTCEIKVSYVDYVVSRTIIAAFDEWLDALDSSKESKYINTAKRVSHYASPVFKYLSLIFCSCVVINLMPYMIGTDPKVPQLASLSLLIFLFLFFAYKFSAILGRFVENSIDSSSDISYINITKGDAKMIKDVQGENKNAIIKACAGTLITFVLNFSAKYLALHLKI